jgi:hypothetical protein
MGDDGWKIPWNTVLVQKLIVAQLAKHFSTVYAVLNPVQTLILFLYDLF